MELVLVLYLLSGLLKAFMAAFNIPSPVELTTFLAALSVVVYIVQELLQNKGRIIISRDRIHVLLSFFLFWVWMICSLSYTVSYSYSIEKVVLFGTNFVPILLICLKRNFNIRLFLMVFIISSLSASLIYSQYLFNYISGQSFNDSESIISLYLGLAMYCGISLIALLTSKSAIFSNNLDKIFMIFCLIMILILGGRGPLIFVILCIVLYLISRRGRIIRSSKPTVKKFKGAVFITVVLMGVAVVIYQKQDYFAPLFERTMGRMSYLVDGVSGGDMGESASGRLKHISQSVDIIGQPRYFFIGTGIGGYSVVAYGIDGRGFPHNMILEIWTELGLIGLLLFLIFFITLFAGKIRKKKMYVSGLVILFTLLNVMKSYSLVDIRVILAIWCLYGIPANLDENNPHENTSYLQ